jgi:hypothetical protein
MSNKVQSKQIENYKLGRTGALAFSAVGVSDIITTQLTSAASSDNVPVQVSSSTTTQGFKTTGVNNKALMIDSTSKQAIDDGFGNEVYGRLTEAAGVYTLSYFSLVAGVETAVTLPASTIDFWVNYNYSFDKMPNDILVRVNGVMVGEDQSSLSGRSIRNEKLTITGLNTFASPTTAKTPIDNSISIYVNGKSETEGASEAFTRSGKVLTWSATNAGYDLETTDDVVAHYNTLEA